MAKKKISVCMYIYSCMCVTMCMHRCEGRGLSPSGREGAVRTEAVCGLITINSPFDCN